MTRESLIALLLMALLLAGCDSGPPDGDGGRSEVGPVRASPQRPGDPSKGYDALVNRSVGTCGLPYRAYAKLAGPAKLAPEGQLPGRRGRNAELPYGLSAFAAPSGVELVTTNCLYCHATPIDGKLVIGLGNELLDLTRDPLIAVDAARAHLTGRAELAEWRRWADRITAISSYLMTDTVGVSSASNLARALMAHRDPVTLAWSDRPLIDPPPEPPLPVSVPPLWNLRKKHALFYDSAGRGDQVSHMVQLATLCVDSVAEARAVDAWFVDVRAYLATLEAPDYPYPIDKTLADLGSRVYRASCEDCHGRHGEAGRYPNEVIALGTVGTDPELARAGYGADRFIDWFSRSFYGERSRAAPALGYIAPPLDGVWATAPYLHNGSIPNLETLLDSKQRSVFWEHDRVGDAQPRYDRQRVGWRYRVLDHGKAGAMSWDERNRIYDTGQKGYGNGGHVYGDGLSASDRLALIEYLKTL